VMGGKVRARAEPVCRSHLHRGRQTS
jgi:hypothetical protein